jgi:hypothetical protein
VPTTDHEADCARYSALQKLPKINPKPQEHQQLARRRFAAKILAWNQPPAGRIEITPNVRMGVQQSSPNIRRAK